MTGRWGPEGPPEEAYSRVTDAGRYAPVGEWSRVVVDALLERYDAVAEPGERSRPGEQDAVRVVPRGTGAALTVVWTDFPGVRVRVGGYLEESFPVCGCDACDEDPAQLREELDQLVADVVGGDVVEEVRTGGTSSSVWIGRPGRSEERTLDQRAPAGRTAWGPWPRR